MHDEAVEFKLEEVEVRPGSALDGASVRDARMHEGDGALLLALRQHEGGSFVTNPAGHLVLGPGDVVIAVGTDSQLGDLRQSAGGTIRTWRR
jgi:voltage-gated potassium channel